MVLYFTWKENALFIGKMPKFGEEDLFTLICIQSICLWVSKSRETLHQSKLKWDLDASVVLYRDYQALISFSRFSMAVVVVYIEIFVCANL